MEKNKALGDKLAGDAIKGTFDPPVKKPFLQNDQTDPPVAGKPHPYHADRDMRDAWWDEHPEWGPDISESEKRVLDGNR